MKPEKSKHPASNLSSDQLARIRFTFTLLAEYVVADKFRLPITSCPQNGFSEETQFKPRVPTMIEPFSIASTTLSIASGCLKVAESFANVYGQIRDAEDAIQSLNAEIDSLNSITSTIRATYNKSLKSNSLVPKNQEFQFWKNVDNDLIECEGTIKILAEEVQKIANVKPGGLKIWGKAKKAAKINLNGDKISRFKRQIEAYRQSMSTSLQCITL